MRRAASMLGEARCRTWAGPDVEPVPDCGRSAGRTDGAHQHLQHGLGCHSAGRHDDGDAKALHVGQCGAAGGARRAPDPVGRAAYHFEAPPEELDMADGQVYVAANPRERLPLADLAAVCAAEGLPLANLALFKAPFKERIDAETGQGDVFPDFTFGAQAVEVAVDTETGEITLLKSVACHDVGRAIN